MDDLNKSIVDSAGFMFAAVMLLIIIYTAYGNMNFQGNPQNWDNFNGYKIAGSFLVSNYAGEFGRLDKKTINSLKSSSSGEENCGLNLPGFSGTNGFLQGYISNSNECGINSQEGVRNRIYSEEPSEYYSLSVRGGN